MPALLPTGFTGTITWLGQVTDASAGITSHQVDVLFAAFAGVSGEVHAGLTRKACSRTLAQYPRDTEIRNVRQLSILSAEELAAIAAAMGLATLDPGLLGATMVISGIPDFTHLPPSSRLQGETGASLVVDMSNRPCQLPAKAIEMIHTGYGAAFKPSAQGLRGVTAWVEREGILAVGHKVTLHLPDQRPWAHLDEARGGS